MTTFRHYFKIFLNILIPCVWLVLLFWLGPKVLVFFWPFVIGFLLAKLANPLVTFISDKCNIRRKAVSAMVIILVLFLIALFFYGVGTFLARQISGFIEDLPDLWAAAEKEIAGAAARFTDLYNKLPGDFRSTLSSWQISFEGYVSEIITRLSTPTVNTIGQAVEHIPNMIMGIIMCFLAAYFFVADKEYMGSFMHKYMPAGLLHKWEVVAGSLKHSVGGYFKAQFKIELWMYLLLYLGLLIADVKYAALAALGMAVLDFLPIFGTGIVLAPWALIDILSGDYLRAIILLALWGLSQLLRQIIQPKIMGDSMGLPPIPTLFLLYIGWRFNGVIGMIFALPVAIVIINLNEAGIFDQAKASLRYLVRDINRFRKYTPEDENFKS